MYLETSEKDKELEKIIRQFAEKEDIKGMTHLLLNWEDRSLLWLIYVESRMAAPSTTKEQKENLKAVRKQALQNKMFAKKVDDFINEVNSEDSEPNSKDFEDYEEEIKNKKSQALERQKLKKQLEKLMYEANELQHKDPLKCINAYKQAIDFMDKNPTVKHEYHYPYAHYIIMNSFKLLVE